MITADLYIDCTGFKSLLLGKALAEPFISFKSTLFCDRAVTGSWKRTEEVILPFTVAETMTTGWCWQIDHPDSIMRGYVYSSDFINDEDAEREFRKKNPNVSDTRVVKFVSGRYNRSWVKNVVAIGNASGFVEPLESTALAIICDESRILAECLSECENQPTPSLIHQYNRINSNAWDIIRDFLGIHYKFNTRYENPFWKSCQNDTKLGKVQELVDYYRENGPSTFARTSLLDPNNIFGMEGYLSLLIGQKVSYQKQYVPTMDEKNIWDLIRKENQTLALSGYGVRETIDIITGPNWYWTPGYFKDRANPSLSSIDLTSYIGEK